jgi:SWI/SNF-related matrix-associated actin-dependent regulator of chromatin subfamily A3
VDASSDSRLPRLDLTVASRAYLLEPQWNPMLEEQALSRVHRIGQTKPVTMIRYVMRNTFEENVITVQKDKKDLVDLALERDNVKDGNAGVRQLEVSNSNDE